MYCDVYELFAQPSECTRHGPINDQSDALFVGGGGGGILYSVPNLYSFYTLY